MVGIDKIAALGGGHGLYQTLRAARLIDAADITAIVTVADDGGSSGRIRKELDLIPPGDLRMAIAALAGDEFWADALQHRFSGRGALAGHALGNLLLAGLMDFGASPQEALDRVAQLADSHGRVLPMCLSPLEIEADVAGLDEDPRVMLPVRGQVAVATTPGSVRRVRLIPERPTANPEALVAIAQASLVTLGPGSWFSSVIPHILVPEIVAALNETEALKVVVLNLSAEPGETQGFSLERHIHMLGQQAPSLRVDRIIVDPARIPTASERRYLERAAGALGAQIEFRDVHLEDESGQYTNVHSPEKLAAALQETYLGG